MLDSFFIEIFRGVLWARQMPIWKFKSEDIEIKFFFSKRVVIQMLASNSV